MRSLSPRMLFVVPLALIVVASARSTAQSQPTSRDLVTSRYLLSTSLFLPTGSTTDREGRVESGRATLSRELRRASFYVGGMRMRSNAFALDAATFGGGPRMTWHALTLRPFVEAAVGRVRTAIDSGGYDYLDAGSESGTSYQQRRRPVHGTSVGGGVGTTATWQIIPALGLEMTGGYWTMSVPGEFPTISHLAIGGGLRLGWPSRRSPASASHHSAAPSLRTTAAPVMTPIRTIEFGSMASVIAGPSVMTVPVTSPEPK